jgi:hypothetical protein
LANLAAVLALCTTNGTKAVLSVTLISAKQAQ